MESDMAELGSWHQGKVTKIGKYQLDDIDGKALCWDGRFEQFSVSLTADSRARMQKSVSKMTAKFKY